MNLDSLYEYTIIVKDNNVMSSMDFLLENNIQYELLEGPENMKIEKNKIFWQANSSI